MCDFFIFKQSEIFFDETFCNEAINSNESLQTSPTMVHLVGRLKVVDWNTAKLY